jgi:hypothetical protein
MANAVKDPNADAPRPADPPLLSLTPAQFGLSLAAALAIFLFVTGPVWKHPGDIGRLDWAILWSYVAIPFLVAGCLLASRRWSLRALLLDALALTLVKYVVTSTIAIVLWATVAPPRGAEPLPPRPAAPVVPEAAIVPTPIDAKRTGAVQATVVGPDGRPVEGALVYVAAGLESYVFVPPVEPVTLTNDGSGVLPRLAVAMVGQRIQGRSADGRLHTLVASAGGATWFNAPLLSSGEPTVVRAPGARGVAEVGCNVHPAEPKSRLLVLGHPFFARSDAGGRAMLRGVPEGHVEVDALSNGETGESAGAEVVVVAEGAAEVRLAIAR